MHVTVKLAPPYSDWNIEDLAAQAGWVLVDTHAFDAAQFPGYHHRTTEKGAAPLDTESRAARRALRTLAFRRLRRVS